jgi:HSP20 family protein
MVNITRYDPFADLDEFFKGFVLRPVRMEGVQAPSIKMDVKEDGQGYTVLAELPGVKKEDVKVTVDGNVVTISGEVKSSREEKQGERVIHSERYHGSVSRSFSLGQNIDESAASAKFDDGVLELKLPKKSGAKSNQIQIG